MISTGVGYYLQAAWADRQHRLCDQIVLRRRHGYDAGSIRGSTDTVQANSARWPDRREATGIARRDGHRQTGGRPAVQCQAEGGIAAIHRVRRSAAEGPASNAQRRASTALPSYNDSNCTSCLEDFGAEPEVLSLSFRTHCGGAKGGLR